MMKNEIFGSCGKCGRLEKPERKTHMENLSII
jgi:hypothetical protein